MSKSTKVKAAFRYPQDRTAKARFSAGKCPVCGAKMECGDESIEERICDECVKAKREYFPFTKWKAKKKAEAVKAVEDAKAKPKVVKKVLAGFNHSECAIVRWLGSEGIKATQALAIIEHLGGSIGKGTCNQQIVCGRNSTPENPLRGGVPDLLKKEVAVLRKAIKATS